MRVQGHSGPWFNETQTPVDSDGRQLLMDGLHFQKREGGRGPCRPGPLRLILLVTRRQEGRQGVANAPLAELVLNQVDAGQRAAGADSV